MKFRSSQTYRVWTRFLEGIASETILCRARIRFQTVVSSPMTLRFLFRLTHVPTPVKRAMPMILMSILAIFHYASHPTQKRNEAHFSVDLCIFASYTDSLIYKLRQSGAKGVRWPSSGETADITFRTLVQNTGGAPNPAY